MLDKVVEYLFVLQYIIFVFDMDMKKEDVEIKLNDETKFIYSKKIIIIKFILLDIQNHVHEQLMVVVRSFYQILLDVYQIQDH